MARAESYHQSETSPPLLLATIPEHVWHIGQSFATREAVVSVPQNRRLTYEELLSEADLLARGLIGLGYSKGDAIGIWSTNNIEWLLLQLATSRIGAILVTVNPAYRAEELRFALKQSEVKGLFVTPAFCHSDYLEILSTIVPEISQSVSPLLQNKNLPALRRVVLFAPQDPAHTPRLMPGVMLWQELLAAAKQISPQEAASRCATLSCHDPINIQYTSGTTGQPKAVMLSHHNILNNAFFSAQVMRFSEHDRLCVPVPFYHCFGLVLSNLLCLSVGACIVIACEHFDGGQVLQAIEDEQCTALHGVPTMFIAELEQDDFANYDLTSLRTGIMAGAPCPPTLMRRVMAEMHCQEMLIGYGATEASPITHLTRPDDSFALRTETVGRSLPHQEVKVVSTTSGKTLPIGEIGELCFRGYHIMQGYYHDPEATKAAVDAEGWLHSGDLGRMVDSAGYVKLTGRLKEMIIRGGENIYPREIEDFLFRHPKVAEVAVIGIPDERYGEEIMAWIQPHSGQELSEEEIRDFCHDKIAHFKIPHYIWFVEEFPMTATGKIQKFRMRELALEYLQGQ